MHKLSHLVRLLPQRPEEFWDRLSTAVEARREGSASTQPRCQAIPFQEAVGELEQAMGRKLGRVQSEVALAQIERHVRSRSEKLKMIAPFGLFHNGDLALARFCYLACRALRPAIVLETGVAYGVTTSFVLQALQQQPAGELLSIDLPPLGPAADSFVGFLVPPELRNRWRLHRGRSRRLLPAILQQAGGLDLFIHDSLHTHRNMTWEFRHAWARLRSGGLLISDDVNQNSAFHDFVERMKPSFSMVVQELNKDAAFGVAMKGSQASS
jgi:predicted O-methyltransferase YrrM